MSNKTGQSLNIPAASSGKTSDRGSSHASADEEESDDTEESAPPTPKPLTASNTSALQAAGLLAPLAGGRNRRRASVAAGVNSGLEALWANRTESSATQLERNDDVTMQKRISILRTLRFYLVIQFSA